MLQLGVYFTASKVCQLLIFMLNLIKEINIERGSFIIQ